LAEEERRWRFSDVRRASYVQARRDTARAQNENNHPLVVERITEEIRLANELVEITETLHIIAPEPVLAAAGDFTEIVRAAMDTHRIEQRPELDLPAITWAARAADSSNWPGKTSAGHQATTTRTASLRRVARVCDEKR